MKTHFVLPEKAMQVLKQYLELKPYKETNQLIKMLESCPTIEVDDKPEVQETDKPDEA